MGNRVAKKVFSSLGVLQGITYYIRDAQGNVMSVYNKTLEENLTLTEQHLYGSARLGMHTKDLDMTTAGTFNDEETHASIRGEKSFELSNHLGNVLSVITDQKLAVLGTTTISNFISEVVSYTDYYPFGAPMDHGASASDRSWSGYRYGFNGKELDNEGTGGGGNTYDYGFRIYNYNLGRFLSVDPISASYPWYTPYQFSGDAPIWAIDLDGLEQAIVIRWYNQNGNCTGQTIFIIENSADRQFGENCFLFMNLSDTPANRSVIDRLASQTSTTPGTGAINSFSTFISSNSSGSTQNTLTDFQGNPINVVDNQGNLTFGIAFVRNSLCISDQQTVNNIITDLSADNVQAGRAKWISALLESDIIYFDDESSTYNPLLDTGNDGYSNEKEINQAFAKLNSNPDKVATVTGNSSTEDLPQGLSNDVISRQRANMVFNLLNNIAGERGLNLFGRITNAGGAGATNADQDPAQNANGQPSVNRNATISYDIPLQTR